MSFKWKKFFKRLSVGLCGVFAAGVLFAGCGGGDSGSSSQGGDPNVLKVGVTNFADTLEPTQNYFGWVVMRYGLGECLTKFDEKMNIQPWLAESWQVSDDHLTWTFKIRDNVKFSNGVALTAEAVKNSIERAFAKNNRAATFFEYESITADGQNLIIQTKKPLPGMPGYLADPLFIIVDTTAEPARDFSKEGPICTGPYMVESFVKERAVMKRNENYWDGAVPYQTVEIPSIDDPNTRAMALQSGDVDVAVNIAAGDIDIFKGNDKFHIDEIASLRVVLARLNQKPDHILSDPKVRAALICGCDRETYNDVLLKKTSKLLYLRRLITVSTNLKTPTPTILNAPPNSSTKPVGKILTATASAKKTAENLNWISSFTIPALNFRFMPKLCNLTSRNLDSTSRLTPSTTT